MEPLTNEEFMAAFTAAHAPDASIDAQRWFHNHVLPAQAKARPEQVRQHPSHPEYRPPNPWTQPLPVEKPVEIKNVAEEVKKQKPTKDYLELFEE